MMDDLASRSAPIDVIDPSTEQVIGRVRSATSREIDAVVAAARRALGSWQSADANYRADVLRKIATSISDRREDLAELVSRELGAPLDAARRIHVAVPATTFRVAASLCRGATQSEALGNSLLQREPVGVVACITPWNYPLHQIAAKVALALAAGAVAVLKPSELTPLSADMLLQLALDAGLPSGVLQVVHGRGDVGEYLARHEGVDMISFTGSTAVGRTLMATAARSIKRISLELGGKSPLIVLDDADLDAAVRYGTRDACENTGQKCAALSRMFVPESLFERACAIAADEAASIRVGDPRDPGSEIGPLISARQRERVLGYIRRGLSDGGRILTGGVEPPAGLTRGYYVRPTVFVDVPSHSALAREEVFGPVLCMFPYTDLDEAVSAANDSIYGLAAAVWSGDLTRAQAVAAKLRAGHVLINGGGYNPLAPFGGFKQSGIGREFGKYGLDEFLEVKAIELPRCLNLG